LQFTSSFYRSFHASQNNNQSTSPIGKAFQNFESAEQIRWKSNNDVDEEYFIERLKKFNFQHYVKKQEVENVKYIFFNVGKLGTEH